MVERELGVVYLVAFTAAFLQWVPLVGEHGLLPAHRFVERVPFRRAPSLFHLRCTDRTARVAAASGGALALAAVVGVVERLPWPAAAAAWALMWALQLSFLNVGQAFWGFGWESLLAEAGFLAIFLGPRGTAAPVLVLWAYR